MLGNPACCDSSSHLQAETFLGWWLDAGNGVARSPAFASWLGPTGALRNQANAALLAWVYGRGSGGGPVKLFCWAEFQVCPAAHAVHQNPEPCPALPCIASRGRLIIPRAWQAAVLAKAPGRLSQFWPSDRRQCVEAVYTSSSAALFVMIP